MVGVCFDTSIFIAYKPTRLPAGFLLSAVVVQEMTTGAADREQVRYWGLMRQRCEANEARVFG